MKKEIKISKYIFWISLVILLLIPIQQKLYNIYEIDNLTPVIIFLILIIILSFVFGYEVD